MGKTVEAPTTDQLDLTAELGKARDEAESARSVVAEIEGHFDRAVRDEKFEQAAKLKERLTPARTAYALAESRARSLAAVIAEQEAEERQRTAEAESERRRERAELAMDEARIRERDAMAEVAQYITEARAAAEALRGLLVLALAADDRVTMARHDMNQAQQDLGVGWSIVSASTNARSAIDRDPVFAELMRRTP